MQHPITDHRSNHSSMPSNSLWMLSSSSTSMPSTRHSSPLEIDSARSNARFSIRFFPSTATPLRPRLNQSNSNIDPRSNKLSVPTHTWSRATCRCCNKYSSTRTIFGALDTAACSGSLKTGATITPTRPSRRPHPTRSCNCSCTISRSRSSATRDAHETFPAS